MKNLKFKRKEINFRITGDLIYTHVHIIHIISENVD